MKILVTGASGLIGGEAIPALAAAGHEPLALPRAIDLRLEASSLAVTHEAPGVIVHAAAVLPPSLFGDAAAAVAAQNRAIDDVVFAAARALRCPLVYVSGTSLYGCVQTSCTEDSPVRPRGPYLEEKHRSEGGALELPGGGVVLRVSSPYGLRQRSSTVLQKFVQRATRGEDLVYFGTGAREQDFTAAADVGSAIAAAAGLAGGVRGVFNVASGRGVAMKDLAALVLAVVGAGGQARAAGVADPEEDCRARVDITKAARDLGWRPVVSLEAGIRELAQGAVAA